MGSKHIRLDPRRETARLAQIYFDEHSRSVYRSANSVFAWLLLIQWLAGISVACCVSPRAWAGATSTTHPHIWAAILLGGAVISLPLFLILERPFDALTRHVVAISQMLTGALLIHLMGGRIETHFHVFGSLAFLAFYRDWRVLMTGSAVVALDHYFRGMYWPESAFGVSAINEWRWLEHTGWVVFIDLFLVNACIRGVHEMRDVAQRRAELEVTNRNIEQTVRERTEELQSSEKNLRTVLEAIPAGVTLLARDGTVLWMNQTGLKLMGAFEPEDLVQTPVYSLIVPEHVSAYREFHDRVCHGETETLQFEVTDLAGRRRWMECTAVSIWQATTEEWIPLAMTQDITERRRYQEGLRRAKEAAEAASRTKSEFLANVSHEIRTPMNGIIGMTELALDTHLSELQREYLTAVQSSAHCLLTIINDILDFSKIEAGKLGLEAIPFHPCETVEEVTRSLAVRAQQKGLELLCTVDSNVPEDLVGDPVRLRQVLVNLAGNATKFTERGEVLISVEREARVSVTPGTCLLHFMVRDTGIGIPSEKLDVIFEAFSQADGSTTRKYGGTGLGLTISKKLVEMMGGRIWVESEPGHGSTFHFTAQFQQTSASQNRPLPRAPEALKGMRVLIVDDNATNRRYLQQVVTGWGMQASLAANGRDALNLLRAAAVQLQPYSLVLLDGHMPEVDGFSLAEQIKSNPELTGCTVLMLTSGAQTDEISRCKQLGLAAYLIKPVAQATLLQAILTALGETMRNSGSGHLRPVTRKETRTPTPPPTGMRILLAEDNIINQKVAVRTLEKEGHVVVVAENGRKALETLHSRPFDLLLLDIQMPEMDGFEVVAAIRSEERSTGRHQLIVAMTAHAMQGDRERCLQAGMDNYVSKPLEIDDLRSVLKELTPFTGWPDETGLECQTATAHPLEVALPVS